MQLRSARFGFALSILLILVVVPTAGAFYVSGQQKPVGNNGEKFRMTGGLKGKWKVTAFHVKKTKPVFKAKGRERFNGCVDVARDGSCSGDPAGKLEFRFRYWAAIQDGEVIELGTCSHRIVAASGGLTGTTGFLMMVDTPTAAPPGLKTHYEGDITPPGFARSGTAGAPRSC